MFDDLPGLWPTIPSGEVTGPYAFHLLAASPYLSADVFVRGSFTNDNSLRITLVFDQGPFSLPAYHPAVRTTPPPPDNPESACLAFDTYTADAQWFGAREYFNLFTFSMDGGYGQAESPHQLLQCFAPWDLADIEQDLRALTERHAPTGPAAVLAIEQYYHVDIVHLERELWKLLHSFLDAA